MRLHLVRPPPLPDSDLVLRVLAERSQCMVGSPLLFGDAARPAGPADLADWPSLALARSGSMSATGRQLGVDASTISRRIAAAEKALKLRLFIRDNTGYQYDRGAGRNR